MNSEELKTGNGNVFFIIGMRRSGTSILRKLISKSKGVEKILFEPHNLWRSIMNLHFTRLNDERSRKEVSDFSSSVNGKCRGAKFALNPGIDALDWVWLHKVYPESKFVIIIRDVTDVYLSYLNQDKDSIRGAIPWETYSPMYHWQLGWLDHFNRTFPERSRIVRYERLIEDPEKEMSPVWELLGVPPVEGLQPMIEQPEHATAKESERKQ